MAAKLCVIGEGYFVEIPNFQIPNSKFQTSPMRACLLEWQGD